ncbi:lycopene cyclase [Winogradskyella echinorum]|uniref:Lycopene cyclase n=1 Tax=Winogradskyella echinorum TaxID=538189 RepID=A0ABR6Y560_9FLAO|nr:lycopene cyclase family protein [Winogradskyella echinorum]MBC3847872.1 lycopene cyclase [Winogradskyella echinorum]MBC5752220.1 lycopene cyclase [Winogradskyella echinorum]
MSKPSHFDIIIIGNGLAGLQLALKLTSESFFSNKEIALIDPLEKTINDKTWSFWETEPSKWNSIAHKSWSKASIITSNKTTNLNLSPYSYKTIRALDFYNEAKAQLSKKKNISFILESVTSLIEKELVKVTTTDNSYTSNYVFDSRIPKEFSIKDKGNISIIQHFKGWVIKTEKPVFDETKLTMMDYRLKDGNQTNFTYVLPFSKTEALIEFTYFTEHLVAESVYDKFIKTYIKDYLKIDSYSILETEYGQIPMTNFNFSKFNTDKVTKIGTGGGWVKGSTGYSFKHTEKKVAIIVDNLKKEQRPSHLLFRKKYKFYDKVFLKVLKDENDKGEWIFERFYSKNKVQTMFRFLDEESTFREELKIMMSLFSWSFIKAFFKTL